jgi:hypothetical protein
MTSSIIRVLALAAVVALLASSRVLAFDRQARGAADGQALRRPALALAVGRDIHPGAELRTRTGLAASRG